MTNLPTSNLILEDGTIFSGVSFGSVKNTFGEVVFNTGMVGYPETLTDPSYKGQILVLTYPLIGNYGVPSNELENGLRKHFESNNITVSGLIISDLSKEYDHYSAVKSLSQWLEEEGIPAIYGIDTRMLTRKLREKGTMLGRIFKEFPFPATYSGLKFINPNDDNLAAQVCTPEPIHYKKGLKKIVLVDCGAKNNIIQAFLRRDISVYRVPHDFDFNTIDCDGIVLSNGPGDPKTCTKTIENIKQAMKTNTPILGICLGCQILGLAAGADTFKLKYGHRSHNQPVNETGTKRCFITSQNHGYAIDSNTLKEDWREWFINDNDGTNEGIIHIHKPFFGAQFHPEASPGPDDTEFIFDMFVRALR